MDSYTLNVLLSLKAKADKDFEDMIEMTEDDPAYPLAWDRLSNSHLNFVKACMDEVTEARRRALRGA